MHFVDREVEVTHPKYGAVNVKFQVPQADDLTELIQLYGSESEVVTRNNRVLARSAPQSSVLRLPKSTAATLQEYTAEIEKEKAQTKNYKPEASGGLSKARKAEAVDKIASLATEDADAFKNLTKDQILEMLGVKLPTAA